MDDPSDHVATHSQSVAIMMLKSALYTAVLAVVTAVLNFVYANYDIPTEDIYFAFPLPQPVLYVLSLFTTLSVGEHLGTINLLSPDVIAKAAASEIRTGHFVSLNLPIQLPSKPSFHRQAPAVKLLPLHNDMNLVSVPVRDDEIHMNSQVRPFASAYVAVLWTERLSLQSGTQWDGLRHFGILKGMCFYQGIPSEDVRVGAIVVDDPLNIDTKELELGIHHWAATGISGRGVLLDMVNFYEKDGSALPYDPCTTHTVPLADIKACAVSQNIVFCTGDILILRMGWTRRYLFESSAEEKAHWGEGGNETFAGVENSDEMKEWLWENHFAAVASDQPAFEAWPPREGQVHLHSTVIAMYGSPIGTATSDRKVAETRFWRDLLMLVHITGEFFDCERLSEVAKELNRYTFFFNSAPLCILGGAASLANASALF
ncbi:hypothetical protein P7C70_g728, partial [Phenoliferia sp. Uapishka_3]